MKQKRSMGYLLIIIITFMSCCINTKAEAVRQPENTEKVYQSESEMQQKVIDYSMSLFDWESIEEAERELRQDLPQGINFGLKDEMNKMLAGETTLTVGYVLNFIFELLIGEIGTFIQFGGRFVLVVLLCNLLQTLSSSFKSKNVSQIGFFVCYMAILLSVVQSFQVMIQLAMRVIDDLGHVMLICVPMLLAFMASTGFVASAGTMAPLIISALGILTNIIKVVILPCIISIVVLEVLNAMSEDFKVDKWIGLFYKGIKWVLNTMLIVSVGLLGLYRLVIPGLDNTVKRATVKFSTAFIPVVGNAVGGTIDFITNGAGLIKNTFSAGVIIWLLLLLSVPLIRLLAFTCIFEVAGAMIEPLGDKKMAKIATKFGKGSKFVLSCVGIVALFCVCSIVICMTIHASGV